MTLSRFSVCDSLGELYDTLTTFEQEQLIVDLAEFISSRSTFYRMVDRETVEGVEKRIEKLRKEHAREVSSLSADIDHLNSRLKQENGTK